MSALTLFIVPSCKIQHAKVTNATRGVIVSNISESYSLLLSSQFKTQLNPLSHTETFR